ncbi:MAG: [protein-PII] uridylyltransferase [Proteobacteria bacterium]|nr:MAG: [protein-PII] uridylyltransferase [Pseudomonadota bacterium]
MSAPEALRPWLAELGERGPLADVPDADVLRSVRGYLAAAREHLAEVHRGSGSGSKVNALHADLMDRLVRRLFQIAESEYFAQERRVDERAAVLAVGGYARREMSIHSDVDLLLLHEGAVTPYVSRLAERIQLWLWDAGLTVGCATRTVADTIALARTDNTVFTGILDTRFLAGDPVFYHEFTDAIRRELLADVESFLERQVESVAQRHEAYGESLYLLQPNVKEGAGGLRDYHAAVWAMRAVLPSARGVEDLLHYGLLTESEMEDYRAALDFLWWVRNELHLVAKRRQDQMSFELQEQVATARGYPDGGPDAPLPVELFMSDYYRHARAIRNYSELAIEQCRARARRSSGPAEPAVEVEDGFRIAGDHLEVPHAAHLRERPLRLLTCFAVAQEHGVPLSRTAQRLVRENLHLVDDAFRRDPDATAAFLRILDSEKRVMRTLVMMNEVGLLSRYLPEWEHIVCRWQHVIYHTYTVDVHSIFLVEELRRLWGGKYEQALPDLTELMRNAEDRPALYLGCLLHDIGKGFGGDHSAKGVERARACVERLQLAPERAARVLFLVAQHLTMSHVGQRRDLADPKTIYEFAKLVGDRINLRNLYLLTFADMRASSKQGWTEWRWALLRELFERTAEVLETGAADEDVAMATIEARVEVRRQAARDELRALGVAEAKIEGFFDEMPRRYFVSHGPRQIARHARAFLAYKEERGVVVAVREMRGEFSEVIVCTRDVHGLYWRVAGTLTARGINIFASNVYTTRSGLALEIYRVATPAGDPDDRQRTWTAFEDSLRRVLAGEVRVEDLVKRRRRPFGAPETPSRLPPTVEIENGESDFYTIVDVSANDRLGLLYDLTRTLAAHDVEIYISKATTVLDQIADTFYVKDARNGSLKKLTDPDRIEALRRALLEAAQLEEAAHG